MNKRIAWLVALLASAVLAAAAAPLHGQGQSERTHISPEEAIAIATMGETGRNDFRISDTGNENSYLGFDANLTFNPDDNEYLVVWTGTDNDGALDDEEDEIYGQRVDAITGREVGANDFRISAMGPDGDGGFRAQTASVAYNRDAGQYLVVWVANDEQQGMDGDEFEVFGRVLDREGNSLSPDDLRLTHVGTDGNADDEAIGPDVVYNSTAGEYFLVYTGVIDSKEQIYGQTVAADGDSDPSTSFQISNIAANPNNPGNARTASIVHNAITNEYLVVWSGSEGPDGELEIYGQRLQSGVQPAVLANIRISDMGPDGDASTGAFMPAATHNATDNRYLVVWVGSDEPDPSGDPLANVGTVYGQLLEADGTEAGENDFHVSDTGLAGDPDFEVSFPEVTYNTSSNQYLVVWAGPAALARDIEIFGQLLEADGSHSTPEPIRISQAGPDDTDQFVSGIPAVAHNSLTNGYFVTWVGFDDRIGLGSREIEIFGQLLDGSGVEHGEDDMLLSDMGRDDIYDAVTPAVAYNATDHEYLVVWSADEAVNDLPDGDFEIYGQRVDAATGREVGPNDFRISTSAGGFDLNYDATTPDVVHNSRRNEYLVVWRNDAQVDDEFEILGRRVNADGTPSQASYRISFVGPTADANFDAHDPAVVYNALDDRYLVTWWGNHVLPGLDPQEWEIYAQILSGEVIPIGGMFRVSKAGPDGDTTYKAFSPRAVHNPLRNQYLVVWAGSGETGDMAPGEVEIFGRLLHDTGAPVTAGDLRISQAGTDGNLAVSARLPDVTFNIAEGEYLVVWQSNDTNAGLPQEKTEIFGQILDASGNPSGEDDFRISVTGAIDNIDEDAQQARAGYDPVANQYLVVWRANHSITGVAAEGEIAAQILTAGGTRLYATDLRLSRMGPDGDDRYVATTPAASCATGVPSCLVVWSGDHDAGTLVDDEREIFGQFMGENRPPLALPDSFNMPQGTVLVLFSPGVLANDTDPDENPLTAILDTPPAHGNLTLGQNGSFEYAPQADFEGIDTFSYHASDGLDVSEPVTVTIEVQGEDIDPGPGPTPLPHAQFLPFFTR